MKLQLVIVPPATIARTYDRNFKKFLSFVLIINYELNY